MPVDPNTLGTFIIAVTAIVMSPGPDTILILRYAVGSGRAVGMAAVVGVQLGLVVHTALAVLGISLVIASSPVLFRALAIVGAAYIGWLGFKGFRDTGGLGIDGGREGADGRRALREAILTNLLNPKVILLFLALLPNFVDPARDTTPQLLFLAGVLIVINVLWQAPMAWAADAIRRWLRDPAKSRAISRAGGAILLAMAVLMLWEHAR